MSVRELLRKIKGLVYRNPRPALGDLDRKLAKYLDFRSGFFIEAGANDGYSQSNTYYLEKKLGWRGILVEGIPELYEKCRSLRSNSEVINCALVRDASQTPVVNMHFAHLMSVVEGSLGDTDEQRKHIETGLEVQRLEGTYSVEVPARTLESVLENIPIPEEIDFFSLDVEGGDLAVLQGLNLARFRPRSILVEARFFDEVDELLKRHDYEMIEKLSHHDFLYQAK